MKFRDRAVLFLATGGYIGKIPLAPGTLGSFWGLPAAYFLYGLPPATAVLTTIVFIIGSIAVAHRAVQLLGREDPGCVVIDEIAGMMVTLLLMPFNGATAAIGFVVFRVLDIFKPFPIRTIERRLAGGAGVVMDDIVAGVMANLLLRAGFAIGQAV